MIAGLVAIGTRAPRVEEVALKEGGANSATVKDFLTVQ